MRLLILITLLVSTFALDFKPLADFTDTMRLTAEERDNLDKQCGDDPQKEGKHWMVTLTGGCIGALISRRHILAPAHCFHGNNVTTVTSATNPLEKRSIALEIYPSDFLQKGDPRKHKADIALLVLEKGFDIPEVKPICMAGDATKKQAKVDQFFYEKDSIVRKDLKRVDCIWNPQEPDYFCASTLFPSVESVYAKQKGTKSYLVALSSPTSAVHLQIGQGTLVAPHLFWICQASGVCVKNKSGESLDHIIIHKSKGHTSKYVRAPLE